MIQTVTQDDYPWRIGVVDPCAYGLMGMVTLLRSVSCLHLRQPMVEGFSSLKQAVSADPLGGGYYGHGLCKMEGLVVRLSSCPQEGLSLLLQLGAPEVRLLTAGRVWVISPHPLPVVCRVLGRLDVSPRMLVMNACLPVDRMREVFCRSFLSPGEVDGDADVLPIAPAHRAASRLTERERQSLWHTLNDVTIPIQARRRGMNPKTLYGQRESAVHKLGATRLQGLLKAFFPSVEQGGQSAGIE